MLEAFFKELSQYLQQNWLNEIISLFLGFFLIIWFYFYKNFLKRHLKGSRYYVYLRTGLSTVILILYYFSIRWWEFKFNTKIISSIYENLTLFFLIYENTKFLFKIAYITNRKLFKFVMFIAFVNITILAVIDISDKFGISLGKKYNLMVIFKTLSLIPISIVVYMLTTNLAKRIPSNYHLLKEFLIKYYLFINFIVIVLGFLWIVNIINLSRELLIGVSLAIIIILFYIFTLYYLNELLNPLVAKLEGQFKNIKNQVFTVITIIFLFISYFILKSFIHLDELEQLFNKLYIVKTDVLQISVASLTTSILFFTFVLNSIFISKSLIRYWEFKKTGEFRPTPIEAIIYNFGVLFASIISLSILGITWKVLIPLIGALGIGAGFGLQSIVNNYISGFIIIFNRKVKIGDIIEIPGSAGKFVGNENDVIFGIVNEIGVINTVVETPDGVEIAIPNSSFVSGNIINYTYSHNRVRVRIPVKVGYDTDMKKVEEILLNITQEFKGLILSFPKPQVWFFEMKDYYNLFYLLFWMNAKHWRQIRVLRSNIYKRMWEEFQKEGIKVPVYKVEINSKNIPLEKFKEIMEEELGKD
ncbi:MAG: hypothetical protein DSY60_00005 [Persephonella sp.]|nr:MAG: hypothetical protein DSY60_00005 [Persephonella sp.]